MRPVLRSSFLSSLLLILALALPAAPVAPAAGGRIYLQAVIPACNPITTDTTWETGNVYVLLNDCALVVQAGATLTIQPGVIVKLFWTPAYGGSRGAGIRVDGRLVARGTASQPIIFTSYADDSVGGDTNGDGSATRAAPGDWYGLVLTSGSETILDYVQVRYGSGDLANHSLDGWAEAQIEVKAGAQFTMTNSEVRAGKRMGIYLNGDGLTPTIRSVHIADHTYPESHYGYALLQSTINMQPSYADLTFSGNTRNEVTIGNFKGNLAQDVTLAGTTFGAFCGFTLCQLIIPQGKTLTVAPGTTLQFDRSFGITIASGGTLRAEGTASQPIIFTSTSPLPSSPVYWLGLQAQYGSTLRLDYTDISYATSSRYGYGGLEISTNDAQVRHTRIHHNPYEGLYLISPSGATIAPVLTNVDVTDNSQYGVYFDARSGSVLNVTWDGGRVANNGWAGFYVYTWNSSVNPTLRNLTIANNGSLGTDRWKQAGIAWDAHNVSPVLEHLTLTGNAGTAIFWYCNGSITARNLTATGNGADELTIPGCTVSGGRQWDLDGAGIPARIAGNIAVAPNALLSLAPGTVLRFDKSGYNNPTRLEVQDQASLIALGTAAKPIVFTAATPEPGWWQGIEAYQRATVTLRHCEVAYGGGQMYGSVYLRWGYPRVGLPVVNIQNCEIHHSASRGVLFNFDSATVPTPPIFQYNHLHDTAEVALANWNGPVLDARNNYWGHASGPYHATQNPGGQGDDVGDNILFYPWLSSPQEGAVAGELMVVTGGPELVSPGETVDYAIQYLNLTTETMRSSVLMMQLPFASEFVGGTGGAIYWPERHQVIWKLGDLAPGAQGFLSVQVRFQWGLPANYTDGSYTIFAAENYNVGALNLAEYNAYQPTLTTAPQVVPLSEGEFTALRNANPTLNTFYQQAMAEGFQFVGAARFTYEDGTRIVNAALRTPNRQYGRVLSLGQDGQVLAYTIGGGQFKAQDTTGGMAVDLAAPVYNFWGSWGQEATVQAAGPTADCGYARCIANCMFNKHPMWELIKKASSVASTWWIPGVNLVWTAYEIFDTGYTYLECRETCQFEALRSEYCCTAGQERWQPTGLKGQCAKYKCVGGAWGSAPDIIDKCDFGERCVAGMGASGGCKSCEEGLVAYQFTPVALRPSEQVCTAAANTPRCRDLSLRVAKDPNDITGPAGDLLPGQTITYTIRYENEGDGRAYGVYVVNQLPDVFDASTVEFVNRTGTYLPATRELVWTIGELGPKGAADSQGIITYTVRLREGLASGTVVANQAVVYFPSVPEETPTNTWVNLVAPLVATPQNLTTPYMTPLAITLSGREISGLPLTYEVVEQPRGGTLSGTAPNLTYTPAADFTGTDGFTFRVSNGTSTSRPAQVTITVLPQGDTTAPRVLWTDPADGAVGVFASATPVFTDTVGPVYAPVILIGMSEPLDESTVHSGTVTLARSSGAAVAASATFDGGTNQIVLIPRVALGDGEYRVTVTTGVKDQAGNALAAPYTTSFMIGTRRNVYVPLVLR